MHRTAIIAAAFLTGALTVSAQTVTLTPSKDSDIYSFTDAATGSISTLGVSTSGAGSPHSQRTLIQFNLAGLSIPATEIASAKLRLFVLPPNPSYGTFAPGRVEVFRQSRAWVINEPPVVLRWNDFVPAESHGYLVVGATAEGTWVEFDATTLVTAWASGQSPNHGFGLQAESELISLNMVFASMEVAPYKPQLVITRGQPPSTTPPVLSIVPQAAGFELRWPVAGSTGWTLQTTGNPGESWTAVQTAAVQSGGQWSVTVPASASGRGFFRLNK